MAIDIYTRYWLVNTNSAAQTIERGQFLDAGRWVAPKDIGEWSVVDNPPFCFWLGDGWERDVIANHPVWVVDTSAPE